MENFGDTGNLLSVLESLMPPHPDAVARDMATSFRRRRVEKGMTRADIAAKARVPLANVARFEQKGLISLQNLIKLATALGYVRELRTVFDEPKFSTTEELMQIRRNSGKTKAYHRKPRKPDEKA